MAIAMTAPASIPSPPSGVVHLGPVPIRAYALCIIAGIVVAVFVGDRRLRARGGRKGVVADIAVWAVPFGLVGARLYHLATNPELYWGGPHRDGTIGAFEIWKGGLGIWGGIAGGAVGAYIAARRYGVRFSVLADAVAPGLAFAQAIGRWGNYFNQELYGRATHLPWALHITKGLPPDAPHYYHPTFLYESLWDVGVALLVIWADRRWRLTRGRAFALYVAAYTAGRGWIEALRVDTAHRFFGLRLNDWTSLVLFLLAVGYLVVRRGSSDDAAEPPADPAGDSGSVDAGRTLAT